MANPTNAVAKWSKGPLRIACTTVATGTAATAAGAMEYFIPQPGGGLWLDSGVSLEEYDYTADAAGPLKDETSYNVSPAERPEFTIECKLTPFTLALFMGSFSQDVTYSMTKHTQAVWSTPVRANNYYMTVEAGVVGTRGIWQAYGCFTKSIKISVPIVDTTGGRPTISADLIGMGRATLADYTGGGAVDALPLVFSQEHYFKFDTATYPATTARKMATFNLTLTNNGAFAPVASVDPDAITLGPLTIEGDVTVVVTSTGATDEYILLEPAALACDTIATVFGATSKYNFGFPVLFDPKGITRDYLGNVVVAKFPFKAVTKSGYTPTFEETVTAITWAA